MEAPAITWEQARAFRLMRMHLVDPLGPRSLRKVAYDLGGIQAQVKFFKKKTVSSAEPKNALEPLFPFAEEVAKLSSG